MYSYLNHALTNNSKVVIVPTTPEGSPLSEVFNGREGNVYSAKQLFVKMASPKREWFLKLQKNINSVLDASGDIKKSHEHLLNLVEKAVSGVISTNAYIEDTPMGRFSNIALNIIIGFPISYIHESIGYYPDYIKDRYDVQNKICADMNNYKEMCENNTLAAFNAGFSGKNGNSREALTLCRIVNQASKKVDDNGDPCTAESVFTENIRKLLSRESGKTFYGLAKVFKTINLKPYRNNKKVRTPNKSYYDNKKVRTPNKSYYDNKKVRTPNKSHYDNKKVRTPKPYINKSSDYPAISDAYDPLSAGYFSN
jgi:hypothetical protein